MEHTYELYTNIQLCVTLIGSLLVAAGMIAAGLILKPSKAVRTMYPYINRHGNKTVMFGYILKKPYIWFLCVVMIFNVVFTSVVFFLHVVIDRTNKYNPFDDFDCFYKNRNSVELSIDEAVSLEEHVNCFAWDLNIGRAMGQATGTLLFAWVVASVVNWVILNLAHHKMCGKNICCIKSYCCKMLCWLVIGAIQLLIYLVPCGLIVTGCIFYDKISFLSFFDLVFFCIVIIGSSTVLWCCVEKEPKNLKEHCEKILEENVKKSMEKHEKRIRKIYKKKKKYITNAKQETPEQKRTRRYIKEIKTEERKNQLDRHKKLSEWAESECHRILINEAMSYVGEDEMKKIAQNAFAKVLAKSSVKIAMPDLPKIFDDDKHHPPLIIRTLSNEPHSKREALRAESSV